MTNPGTLDCPKFGNDTCEILTFNVNVMLFHRGVGAEPLLPWNRMLQTQNAAFQPNQYQMLAGPGGYPPRRDDRGGRQGYPREGRKYPLPPPSGRYSWN